MHAVCKVATTVCGMVPIDSSGEDTPQRAEVGEPNREQVRLAFGKLFTGGASNMGRMCVECHQCDAMLWGVWVQQGQCTQPRCLARYTPHGRGHITGYVKHLWSFYVDITGYNP